MMATLRKWQRDWRWGKWAILFAGIIYVFIGFSIYHDATKELEGAKGAYGLLYLDFVSPFLLYFFSGGALLISGSVFNWRGFARDTLLLKILDELAVTNTSGDIDSNDSGSAK